MEPKQQRRTKTDFEGELIICGCGKVYLSYPALFTHIKTKHEGIVPEGTDSRPTKPASKKETNTAPEEKQVKCGCGRVYLSFSSLRAHLKHNHNGETPEGTDVKPDKPKKLKIESPSASFLIEKGLAGTSTLETLKENTHPLLQDLGVASTTGPLKTCDAVFAEYITELFPVIAEEPCKLFVKYLCMLYDCLNIRGWEMDKEPHRETYCSLKPPCTVPNMVNFFIGTYLPFSSDENPNAIEFTEHFYDWLFSKNYTTIKVSLNQEV